VEKSDGSASVSVRTASFGYAVLYLACRFGYAASQARDERLISLVDLKR
jgi:hypothetical protein